MELPQAPSEPSAFWSAQLNRPGGTMSGGMCVQITRLKCSIRNYRLRICLWIKDKCFLIMVEAHMMFFSFNKIC